MCHTICESIFENRKTLANCSFVSRIILSPSDHCFESGTFTATALVIYAVCIQYLNINTLRSVILENLLASYEILVDQHCTQAQIRFRYPAPFLFFFRVDRKSSWPDSRGARREGGEGGRKGWRKRQVYSVRCLNKGSERKQHLQGLARFFFGRHFARKC